MPECQTRESQTYLKEGPTVSTLPCTGQTTIPTFNIDKTRHEAMEGALLRAFEADTLCTAGTNHVIRYNHRGSVSPELRDVTQLNCWAGRVVSLSTDLLVPALPDTKTGGPESAGSLLTQPGGAVVFLRQAGGSTTAMEVPNASIEYQPPVSNAGADAPAGRVRIKGRAGAVSDWLWVEKEHLEPVDGTNRVVWSLDVKGPEYTGEGVSTG
jgi:hypothetical protein